MVNRYFKIIAVVALVSAGFGEQVLADSGAAHKTQQTLANLQWGTSGGNVKDRTKVFCCSGTLGALVKSTSSSSNFYILSNNHVLARTNQAVAGEDISHRGLIDANCQVEDIVADLTSYPDLLTSNVDAAIAMVRGRVNTTGAILDIGVPSATTATPTLPMAVAKSGRTTGLTCGTIGSTSTTVNVQYQKNCGSGTKFTIKYTGQIVVSGSGFSAGGDSGSLVVTTAESQPVGLLFAGSSSTTIANPIGDVILKITPSVAIVGGDNHSVSGCTSASASSTSATLQKNQSNMTGPSDAVVEFATSIKEQHEAGLMADPAVMGVGIGASDEDPSEAVIVIYLEQGRSHRPIPAEIDGVRTKTILSDRIRAFGWNESEHASCTVK